VAGFFAGGWWCLRRNPALFFFALIIVAVNASFFVGWRRESYFPSYIVVCLFTAIAAHGLLFRRARNAGNPVSPVSGNSPTDWRRLVYIGVLCLIPLNILTHYPRVDRSADYFGESLLKRVFLSLENRSLFLTGMSWFNFYYHNDIMRLRDDVTAVKAWDLLDKNPPSLLTARRYPQLNLPDPARHRFDSSEGTLNYVQDLLTRNRERHPILMDQNLTFFEQLPLEDHFVPYRNLLLKYRPSASDNNSRDATGAAFAEFRELLRQDLARPGVYDTQWINKVSYYIPSFAAYYHNSGRYREEREALDVMYAFLGHRGLEWQFKSIHNLILDHRIAEARKKFQDMQTHFPDHYRTHLLEGLLLVAEGKLRESVTPLREAVRLSPLAFEPRRELANAYQRIGDGEQAQKEAQAAGKLVRNLRELALLRQSPVR